MLVCCFPIHADVSSSLLSGTQSAGVIVRPVGSPTLLSDFPFFCVCTPTSAPCLEIFAAKCTLLSVVGAGVSYLSGGLSIPLAVMVFWEGVSFFPFSVFSVLLSLPLPLLLFGPYRLSVIAACPDRPQKALCQDTLFAITSSYPSYEDAP